MSQGGEGTGFLLSADKPHKRALELVLGVSLRGTPVELKNRYMGKKWVSGADRMVRRMEMTSFLM